MGPSQRVPRLGALVADFDRGAVDEDCWREIPIALIERAPGSLRGQ